MLHLLGTTHAATAFETRWGERNTLSHPVSADMRDGDAMSILFRFAESVVNIAHIPKSLYHTRKQTLVSYAADCDFAKLVSSGR
jgi:hypothetical protein